VSKSSELESLEAALAEIPVFPLPQVVLFPRALLPLHIFEPRYRAMLKDALATHRVLVMALQLDAPDKAQDKVEPKIERSQPKIAAVCGAGIILEHHPLADGRSNIVLHGLARLRIEELPFVPPYRRARATILHDLPSAIPMADRTALLAEATAFAGEVHKRDPTFTFRIPPSLEPGPVADLCAHHLIVDAPARQRILEQLDPAERVRMVTAELAVQRGTFRTSERGTLH
jgi:Lon protease-like protein